MDDLTVHGVKVGRSAQLGTTGLKSPRANSPRTINNVIVPNEMFWMFGDQLGDHFIPEDFEGQIVLIESRGVFRRRAYHRAKAHLMLTAMRRRAAELGDRAVYIRAETYTEALEELPEKLQVRRPTSWAALRFLESLGDRVEILEPAGFVTSVAEFSDWADRRGRKRLLMEDFYRETRRRTGLLMVDDQPIDGRWNFDSDNREPPPKGEIDLGLAEPWWPAEDEVDAEVRRDLDEWANDGIEFIGRDGPRRFATSQVEAEQVLADFIEHRLAAFGKYEDAMMGEDDWMAHSMLSVPLNLGLLDPLAVAKRVEQAYYEQVAPIAAVEGFIRQVVGWRDYVWHLYWHLGEDYRTENALDARTPLPQWWQNLDADALEARCLSDSLRKTRDYGWAHHIERLMVLGSWAIQQGYDPDALTDWFRRSFVDGYDWVMVPNVVGMSQYADGGVMATKPYTSGGAYLKRMSNHCGDCRYKPTERVGEQACPFTTGYWSFLADNAEALAGNARMNQPLAGMRRLSNLDEVRQRQAARGTDPP